MAYFLRLPIYAFYIKHSKIFIMRKWGPLKRVWGIRGGLNPALDGMIGWQ